MMKLYTWATLHPIFCSFASFGEYLYQLNRRINTNSEHRVFCMKNSIKRTYKTLAIILLVDIISVIIYLIFPAYMWMKEGNHVWFLPVLIPFTSLENVSEYYMNVAMEMYFSLTALIPAICLDMIFVLFVCHHYTTSRLIEESIHELDDMWKNKTHTKPQSKNKLINILT